MGETYDFFGDGLRPVGVYNMCDGFTDLVINGPVLISSLHKLTRRDRSDYLKGIIRGCLKALHKRDKTPGIKSIITQIRSRLILIQFEEGIVIFLEPDLGELIVYTIISMFEIEVKDDVSLNMQLNLVDTICDEIDGCYRGRIPSCIMEWFTTDIKILRKLKIDEPPLDKYPEFSKDKLDYIATLNLNTKRDKRIFKKILEELGVDNWIIELVDEVSHKEFGGFIYISGVLSKEKLYKKIKNYNVDKHEGRLPSIKYLREIGTYDCHTGKGTLNDFLDKGMRVNNMAPRGLKICGKSTEELENIYLRIKKEVGCKRFNKNR